MKIKQKISNRVREGLSSRGLRMRIRTTTDHEVNEDIKNILKPITSDFQGKYLASDILSAKIIARALKADGSFPETSDQPWFNLGASAAEAVKGKGEAARQAMSKRLVNCVSQPLVSAAPHILSLATLLISKGQKINFERLFWDLRHWDNPERQIKYLWASGFNQLPQRVD